MAEEHSVKYYGLYKSSSQGDDGASILSTAAPNASSFYPSVSYDGREYMLVNVYTVSSQSQLNKLLQWCEQNNTKTLVEII